MRIINIWFNDHDKPLQAQLVVNGDVVESTLATLRQNDPNEVFVFTVATPDALEDVLSMFNEYKEDE